MKYTRWVLVTTLLALCLSGCSADSGLVSRLLTNGDDFTYKFERRGLAVAQTDDGTAPDMSDYLAAENVHITATRDDEAYVARLSETAEVVFEPDAPHDDIVHDLLYADLEDNGTITSRGSGSGETVPMILPPGSSAEADGKEYAALPELFTITTKAGTYSDCICMASPFGDEGILLKFFPPGLGTNALSVDYEPDERLSVIWDTISVSPAPDWTTDAELTGSVVLETP